MPRRSITQSKIKHLIPVTKTSNKIVRIFVNRSGVNGEKNVLKRMSANYMHPPLADFENEALGEITART